MQSFQCKAPHAFLVVNPIGGPVHLRPKPSKLRRDEPFLGERVLRPVRLPGSFWGPVLQDRVEAQAAVVGKEITLGSKVTALAHGKLRPGS